ncbi:YqhR family membrane protein [Lederbergia sp. NSJ-179]|uniref:YqhR family membrane protein n=1 Tax=Lederbergia sp. NSJ-179 TaxID=2931402 RepID=UPI001FD61E42|nr:YqhR family membrane protein [Lederbergia sp. NSJ-179]MCJ7839342.1 YqhR family membrane protein [Lederbergia sp. NSJ-179]
MEKEKNSNRYSMPLTHLAMLTGFVAGAGGALLCFIAHYLNFTEIKPSFILTIFRGNWQDGWLGIVISCLIYGLLSILVAFGYYVLLKRKKSIIWGGVYGAALFCLIFFVFYPIIPTIQLITNYNLTTILTEACFFVLYGIFIGYSISYEYNEQQYWENVKSE